MPHGVEVEMVQHCLTCLKVSRKLVHLVLGRRYQDRIKKINCSAPPIDAVDGDALPRSRRPLLRQRLSGEQCWLVFAWTPVWQKAGVSVGTLGFTMEMFVKQESPEEINTQTNDYVIFERIV